MKDELRSYSHLKWKVQLVVLVLTWKFHEQDKDNRIILCMLSANETTTLHCYVTSLWLGTYTKIWQNDLWKKDTLLGVRHWKEKKLHMTTQPVFAPKFQDYDKKQVHCPRTKVGATYEVLSISKIYLHKLCTNANTDNKPTVAWTERPTFYRCRSQIHLLNKNFSIPDKPILVAKIFATDFGVLFVLYLIFRKICLKWA